MVFVAVSIIALQLFLESYTVLFSFTTILVNELQPENASEPILVTLSGISMLVNELHIKNALLPMLVTLSGISMLDND